jgi:hypothetical protein
VDAAAVDAVDEPGRLLALAQEAMASGDPESAVAHLSDALRRLTATGTTARRRWWRPASVSCSRT